MIPKLRSLLPAATMACALAPAALGAGSTTVLFTSGFWTVTAGYANDGTEVCSMVTRGNSRSFFSVKRYGHQNYLTIQFGSRDWNLNGNTMPVAMQMDNNSRWTATGDTAAGHGIVEFTIGLSDVTEFVRQFSYSEDDVHRLRHQQCAMESQSGRDGGGLASLQSLSGGDVGQHLRQEGGQCVCLVFPRHCDAAGRRQ